MEGRDWVVCDSGGWEGKRGGEWTVEPEEMDEREAWVHTLALTLGIASPLSRCVRVVKPDLVAS